MGKLRNGCGMFNLAAGLYSYVISPTYVLLTKSPLSYCKKLPMASSHGALYFENLRKILSIWANHTQLTATDARFYGLLNTPGLWWECHWWSKEVKHIDTPLKRKLFGMKNIFTYYEWSLTAILTVRHICPNECYRSTEFVLNEK